MWLIFLLEILQVGGPILGCCGLTDLTWNPRRKKKKSSPDVQKAAGLTLCLQPPAKTNALLDLPHVWMETGRRPWWLLENTAEVHFSGYGTFINTKNNNNNTCMLLSNEGIVHFNERPPSPPKSPQTFHQWSMAENPSALKFLAKAQTKECS